jgi:hypothetical protein
MLVVVDVKLTRRVELAEAVNAIGEAGSVTALRAPKVMVCERSTGKLRVTAEAAR